jgi:hypothetical protein
MLRTGLSITGLRGMTMPHHTIRAVERVAGDLGAPMKGARAHGVGEDG